MQCRILSLVLVDLQLKVIKMVKSVNKMPFFKHSDGLLSNPCPLIMLFYLKLKQYF
jgi:hypothetical protein